LQGAWPTAKPQDSFSGVAFTSAASELRLIAAALPVSSLSASSGDDERYFELGGRRYSPLLEPLSGWPFQGWQLISVLAPVCLAARALSSIAMLKGDAALDFLDNQAIDYLAVDASGRQHCGGMVARSPAT
jgi:thiamine biosynthesis lipoprotein